MIERGSQEMGCSEVSLASGSGSDQDGGLGELREAIAREIAFKFDIDVDIVIGMYGRQRWEAQWYPMADAILAIPRIREALQDGEHDPATCPVCLSPDK